MDKNRLLKKVCSLLLASVCLLGVMCISTPTAEAKDTSITVKGKVYDLDVKAKYDYTAEGASNTATSTSNTAGSLMISGNVTENGTKNGFTSYSVKENQIGFSYTVNSALMNAAETSWHIDSDNTKNVAGIELESKMASGAFILQTSFDGSKWITDQVFSDVFNPANPLGTFFTSKEIQLINGCYYRVIIAYKETRKLDATQILFYSYDHNYEDRQIVEVYEFYAITKDSAEVATSSAGALRVGTLYSVEKDKGFIGGTTELPKDDPHYGHEIGHFGINGYTRQSSVPAAESGYPVFLKNVGDKVTLWFIPEKDFDVDCLFGNSNLSIAEDKNGYDSKYSFGPTNFKHGALIIRFTDYLGNPTTVEYIDFLAACLRTGADTRVQLFEEGRYELTLDYEIKNSKGIDSFTDYKITYCFEIRNGNCQVFPFDTKTNNELFDYARTENGFRLDWAKSRYLEIQVAYSVIKVDPTTGMLSLDQRWDRPAKDNDSYAQPGVYVFTVKNLYSGTPGSPEVAHKTIYVGTDKYICALAANKLTIDELNDLISEGAEIQENGTYILPQPEPEPEPVAEPEPEVEPEPEESNEEEDTAQETVTPTSQVTDTSASDTKSEDVSRETPDIQAPEEDAPKTTSTPIVIGSIAVVIIIAGVIFAKKRKKR